MHGEKEMNAPDTYIPPHIRDGFKLYIEQGILPGSFCTAVLSNDLAGALGRADHINRNHLHSIVAWIYNYAPSTCWGSKEKVNAWMGEKNEQVVRIK